MNFVLSSFIPLYHGLRLTPAWLDSIPELPQGPEEVLSLETLERSDLFYHGTPVLVCRKGADHSRSKRQTRLWRETGTQLVGL